MSLFVYTFCSVKQTVGSRICKKEAQGVYSKKNTNDIDMHIQKSDILN